MDYELVLIKPDELFLKSEQVMRRMMKQLVHNITVCLKENDLVFDHITSERLRILIKTPEPTEVIEKVKDIYGITTLTETIDVGLDALEKASLDIAKDAGLIKSKSFAVRVKRVDKELKQTSKEMETSIGGFIQDEIGCKVNLKKPDVQVNIEVLQNKAYIYTDVTKGFGGLPVGVSGKVVVLIKDADDLEAAKMMLKRGCEVFPLHFRTEEKLHQKFLNECKALNKFAYGSRIKPWAIKGELDLDEAVKYAQEVGAKALVLGNKEITKDSLKRIELPIFTPLVGLDEAKAF